MISTLLKKQPLSEIVTRARFMFDGKARWPKGPYTLATLVGNFDSFVETQTEFRPIQEL